MYIFPLILYFLSELPLLKNHQLALQRSLSKLLWGVQRPMVRRQVCCQHPSNGDQGMPDLENQCSLKNWLTWSDPCQRTQSGDEMRAVPFLTLSQTPKMKVNISQGVKHCLSENTVRLFTTFLDPVIFLSLQRNCIGI